MNWPGRRNAVSSTLSSDGGLAGRAASFALAVAAVACHAVHHDTRNDPATAAVERSRAARASFLVAAR